MKRIAVDIGGTFTDCFIAWGDRQVEGKALTSHHNLALGFLEAVADAATQLGVDSAEAIEGSESIRYGTTLGTNTLIERKGPRIGVLVTMGFESMIRLSRGRGYGEGLPRHLQVDLPRATRPRSWSTPTWWSESRNGSIIWARSCCRWTPSRCACGFAGWSTAAPKSSWSR